MVTTLRELFAQSRMPSHDAKESAAQSIAAIIEQAQAIGQTHAQDEHQERSIAWGGNFRNTLGSAWDIVNNFVQRIADWMSDQDAEELSEDEIVAEVDTLAETAASVEVPAAIEGAVMDGLQAQGLMTIRWIAQPDACDKCRALAEMGSVPLGTDFDGVAFPPLHAHCRCSLGTGDES